MRTYFVYMVECTYGTYYTGYTVDSLAKRMASHNQGTGAKYLRGRAPVRLVYSRKYRSLSAALRAEIALKKLTRKQKQGLIAKP